MPPVLDPGRVHLPPEAKPIDRRWGPEQQLAYQEWMVLLRVLHDAVVRPELWVETP